MYQANANAYTEAYRSAIEAIDPVPQYFREEDLELARTADLGPWVPTEDVLELMPRAGQIPVMHIDQQTDLTKILLELIDAQDVSLMLMGEQVKARERPTIIVISTYEHHYTIDPNCDTGIEFLKRCLGEKSITFWTTGGLYDACCLWHQYRISLKDSNARDCLGLHLHMMKVLAAHIVDYEEDSGGKYRRNPIYPVNALKRAKQPKRLESFDSLVWIWLDLDSTRSIELDPSQMRHLARRPFSQTAENLIRKRCTLVTILAKKLLHYATIELEIMNETVLGSLTSVESDSARRSLRKRMLECEELKKPHRVYFSHMERHNSFGILPSAGDTSNYQVQQKSLAWP